MKKLATAIFVLVFLFFTRFYASRLITPSLTHDELIYASNAQFLSYFNTSMTGNKSWFSLEPIHHMYAEWTASLIAPFFWLFKDPIVATHALSGLMSFTLPFVFGWFMYGAFSDKKTALIGGALLAISPLVIQFSKLAYDSFFALYFYLLAGAIYLNLKNKYIYLSISILLIGFFNYQGYKLLLLPWTILLYFLKSKPKTVALPICGLLVSLVYGFFILPNQIDTSKRLGQTIFTDTAKIESVVDERRSGTLNPSIGKYLANDQTAALELGLDNLLSSLDLKMLFLRGEPTSSGFALYSHGFFYSIDALFIIIGIAMMVSTKSKQPKHLATLVLLPTLLLPAVLSTISQWYLMRSLLFYIMLYIPISFGIRSLIQHRIGKIFTGAVYSISLVFFLYQYFFQYPISRADASEFHERLVVEYVSRVPKDSRVIVYDDEPHYLYMSHLLHHDVLSQFSTKNDIVLDNILYTNTCQDEKPSDVIITSSIFDPCKDRVRTKSTSIVSLKDSGEKYSISSDPVCKMYELGTYVRLANLSDFDNLNADNEKFCTRFIVNQQKI